MDTRMLEGELVNWSVLNSGFEPRRSYIGLSGIGDCERLIYERFREGQMSNVKDMLKTRISYELEAALVERLKKLGKYQEGEEILLHGGLVQGHTDGSIGKDLLEIKTVPNEAALPQEGKLSHRNYWQVQAYLHYTKRIYAHVVVLARDSGLIRVVGVKYRPDLGEEIEAKVERLVKAIREYEKPGCSCGRCSDGQK